MASTPPAQIRAEAQTPPTPLHGSAYHSKPSAPRYNTRSRKTPDSAQTSFTQSFEFSRTPKSPRTEPQPTDFHSPQTTPKRKSTRHVQVISPASPNFESAPFPTLPQLGNHSSSYLSATAVLSEGMLPTPVKTPQKNKIPKLNMAARVLFQDSPRKQKKRRHNGFSLENIDGEDQVQIHIDSQDQVPEVDPSEDNPFYTAPESKKRTAASQRASGPFKRRKVREEKKKLDPQVEEAIEKDEGMVYVFRGKKVYRRFDDEGDEEEVIDEDELGLLRNDRTNTPDAQEIIRPLRTMTRKSIRPRRLFQDNQPKAQPQATQSDEEVETEVEDDQVAEEESPRAVRHSARTSRNSGEGKKGSPFDTWPRLKAGSRATSSTTASKGRKRTAAEALEV